MLPSELPFAIPSTALETPRLILRIDTEEMYTDAFRTKPDAYLKEHFGIAGEAALQLQKEKIRGGLTTYRSSVLFFHLVEKSGGIVVGNFAFHNWYPAHSRAELGYAMADEAYKNKGFMREALPSIIAFGFEALALNRMEAFIHPENLPSRKLVEAAGFTIEGRLLDHYCNDGIMGDSMLYRLLRKEYAGGVRA